MLQLGFDIGGTHARLCVFDAHHQVVADARRLVRDDLSPQGVLHAMRALADEALQGLDASQVVAVGVGIAGQLDVTGQRVRNAPNLGWREEPFLASVQAAFPNTRARLVNDLNALLWGEALAGAAKGARDVLAVFVGSGVGGAIIAGGALIEGAGGNAGEIGHVKVIPNGRLCGCGERGCVEAYAGGVHLERRVAALASAHGWEDLAGEGPIGVDLARADASVGARPELAALWEQTAAQLALVMANACTLLNPQVLLLGGGVLARCPTLRAELLALLPELVLAVAREDLQVRDARLEHAAMLGAASLASAQGA